MIQPILTDLTASITEFKVNPMVTMNEAEGQAIAVLNRNKPAFYCVPSELYEYMMEALDDAMLLEEIAKRENEEEIEVSWDDL